MFAWIWARRGWFGVVVPYVAMCAIVVVALGVLDAKTQAAEARADSAALRAEIAADRANEATAEAQQSCLVQQEAQEYTNHLILTIAASLPSRVGDTIHGIIAAEPLIEC